MGRKQITIRADDSSLKWILNLTDSTSQLAPRRFRLSEYDFDVVHWANVNHQVADALSHLQPTGENQTLLNGDLPVLAIDEQENREQSIHIIRTADSEETPIRATEK